MAPNQSLDTEAPAVRPRGPGRAVLGAMAGAALAGAVGGFALAGPVAAVPGLVPGVLAVSAVAALVVVALVVALVVARRRARTARSGGVPPTAAPRAEALHRSVDQLRIAEQVAGIGSYDWMPAAGVLHWSDEHFRLWGHAPGSLTPDYAAFRAGVHPDDLPALEARLQQTLRDGSPYDCVHRVCRADGSVIEVHARGEALRGPDGQVQRMVGTVQDITARRRAEAALRTHEFVVNAINDPVSVVDAQGVYRLVNDAWCRITGMPRAQALGRSAERIQGQRASTERQHALRECIEAGERRVVHDRIEMPGTGVRCWETSYFPFRDDAVGERLAVVVTRDVTEQESARTALADSVKNLRRTLNATGDAIFASDASAPDQRLLFVNDQTLALWGIPEERAATLTPADVIAYARPLFLDPEREVARVGAIIASRAPIEDRVELRDGRVLMRRCIPTLDADHEVRVWVFRDVTREERALRALQASEAEQRALLDAFPGYIACFAPDFRCGHVNERLARVLGQPAARLVGRLPHELFDAARGAQLHEAIARVQAGRSVVFEWEYAAADGRPQVDVMVTLAPGPPRDDGPPMCYAFGTDISRLKRSEAALVAARDEALRANQAKSQFLSAMSHELRTPMNAVLGFGQLLEADAEHRLTGTQAGYVREILRGGRHLLALINEVLDLARIEAGRLAMSLEPVPVQDLLHNCLALVQPLAREHDIEVRLDPDCIADGHVLADRMRLKQVLLNLLGNAIKYNHRGGRVELACRLDDAALRIEVRDTGRGLDEAQQQRLFQAFERLDADRSGVEGAGIGLALSRRLVELMHGEIGVRSQVGVGSVFWLRLARAERPVRADARAGAPTRPALLDGMSGATAPRVLLYIEDNPVNAMLMEAMLARLPDVRLRCAEHPEQGLEMARRERPDLVLLDIQLPGMDGYEVLRRLRADPATCDIPAIAVSANAMSSDLEQGRAAGFADYLTKPLDMARLLQAVRTVLADGATV